MSEGLPLAKIVSLIIVGKMCVFVSRPTGVIFHRKNGETPEWVVDFLREKTKSENLWKSSRIPSQKKLQQQRLEIVEDFSCEATTNLGNQQRFRISICFCFVAFFHIIHFSLFSIFFIFPFFHFFIFSNFQLLNFPFFCFVFFFFSFLIFFCFSCFLFFCFFLYLFFSSSSLSCFFSRPSRRQNRKKIVEKFFI